MNANPLTENKMRILQEANWIVQEKLKGIRCFAYVGPEGTKLQTRGDKFVEHNFKHIAEVTSSIPFVLDGELYAEGYEDEVIAGWANCKYLLDDTSCVNFHAFDCVEFDSIDLTNTQLKDRLLVLDGIDLTGMPFVKVPSCSIDQAMDLYSRLVAKDKEGIMIKDLQKYYAEGKRPQNNWYKLKSVSYYDVVIMGWKPGQGKYDGLIGSLTYGFYINGKPVPCGQVSGFTDDFRKYLTDNIHAVQRKVIEVCAAGMDKKSYALIEPRFIRFRDDKEPQECLLNQS